MIIFDLDGTLADCEHRRHFVVKPEKPTCTCNPDEFGIDGYFNCPYHEYVEWKPDWKSFYEACDEDTLIEPVSKTFWKFSNSNNLYVEIWSGRCESVRKKTIDWLYNKFPCLSPKGVWNIILKMRPIDDNTPDDVLKERWLDEAISEGKTIDFVFDDRLKVVRMWRRRGIFVFDVSQGKGDF